MNVTVSPAPKSSLRLRVELPPERLAGAISEAVRHLSQRTKIPGFRPGKATRPVLERTLGVPLFQEQLMDMARALGDCTRDEADLLRRAMGSKRGVERIESIKEKLYSGMAAKGLVGEEADAIYLEEIRAAGLYDEVVVAVLINVTKHSLFTVDERVAFLEDALAERASSPDCSSASSPSCPSTCLIGGHKVGRGAVHRTLRYSEACAE